MTRTEPVASASSGQGTSTPASPMATQRLFGEDSNVDESSDNDRAVTLATSLVVNATTEDVVDFSIGEQQVRMKSPETPALEKFRALCCSRDYEDPEADALDAEQQSPQSSVPPSHQHILENPQLPPPNVFRSYDGSVSTPGASVPDNIRSSASKPFLQDSFSSLARRNSSGSSNMVGSLRKLLPDLPSIPFVKSQMPFLGLSSKVEDDDQADRRTRSSDLFPKRKLPRTSAVPAPSLARSPVKAKNLSAGEPTASSDEQESGKHKPNANDPLVPTWSTGDQRRKSLLGGDGGPKLRRATSDISLFMRNDLEKLSTQDGAQKWNDVSERVNARYKAITDSLQDSAIGRMSKMPSISLGSFKARPSRSYSDTFKLTMAGNSSTAGLEAEHAGCGRQPATSPQTHNSKQSHPILNQAASELVGDVVVLGGYRGSILRSATAPHKQLWVPVKVGMNIRRVDLEVGLSPEDEEKMSDTIIPAGVLSHIGPIDICRRLLKRLKKSSRARPEQLRVHNYGYDWRLSPHLLSRQLISFLETLECNQPGVTSRNGKGAVVIAHSLGGVITRHAVNQRPDLFAGVIYAGVPQHCINILGPLRKGDDVLLSSRVLTAQVNFTLRTSYVLLPESGRCFVNNVTGKRYDVDFFDVETWKDHCLSPCVSGTVSSPHIEERKSIIEALSESLPSLPMTNRRKSSLRRAESPNRISLPLEESIDAAKNMAANFARKIEEAVSSLTEQSLERTMEPTTSSVIPREPIATVCTIPRADALAYLERTLKATRQFKRELGFRTSHQEADLYPPISVLYSDSVPTVFAARVDSREAIKLPDAYDNLAFAAGDGIVLSKAARPPEGYKIVKGGLVRSERGHIGLLGDLEAVGRCLGAVIEARKRGVGTGAFAKEQVGEQRSESEI